MQVPSEEVAGTVRIDATREDFDAAAKLYRAINQEIGSQEAKMTKNEAAALRTIERMGWETFTIRTLQEAMGLSYSQTRRILQGYSAKGAVYAGLLEKCPAMSMVDATLVDDTTEVVIRRHEHLFQFDAACYREWMGGLAVWLDDDDDSPPDGGPDSGCNQGCKEILAGGDRESTPESRNEGDREEIENPDPGSCTTSPGTVRAPALTGGGVTLRGSIAGLSPGTKSPVLPLPGVLDPGEFERVRVALGRCTICNAGKAVYRSREASACEGCYARLVREQNGREGVR